MGGTLGGTGAHLPPAVSPVTTTLAERPLLPYEPVLPLTAAQCTILRRSLRAPGYAVLLPTGAGKTACMVHTIAAQAARGWIHAALVIAPNGVHTVWPAQFDLHLPPEVRERFQLEVGHARQSVKQRRDQMVRMQGDRVPVLCLNVDLLSTTKGVAYVRDFLTHFPRALFILDEAQRIKTPGARRTKAALALAPLAPARRFLTATPVTKGYENLYAPYAFLDKRIIGVQSAAEFRARYCHERVLPGTTVKLITGYKNIPDLLGRIAPVSYGVARSTLDLPPLRTKVRHVVLPDEQAALYRSMAAQSLALARDGKLATVNNVLTQAMRLQQILSGYLPMDDGTTRHVLTGRLAALLDALTDDAGDDQVLVWVQFQYDVHQLCGTPDTHYRGGFLDQHDWSALPFYGPLSVDERMANLAAFQQGKVRVLVATMATGGVGYSINEAGTALFYSHTANWEQRFQSEGRNYRLGQTQSVLHEDLIAPGTLDVRWRHLNQLAAQMNTAALGVTPALLHDPAALADYLFAEGP